MGPASSPCGCMVALTGWEACFSAFTAGARDGPCFVVEAGHLNARVSWGTPDFRKHERTQKWIGKTSKTKESEGINGFPLYFLKKTINLLIGYLVLSKFCVPPETRARRCSAEVEWAAYARRVPLAAWAPARAEGRNMRDAWVSGPRARLKI